MISDVNRIRLRDVASQLKQKIVVEKNENRKAGLNNYLKRIVSIKVMGVADTRSERVVFVEDGDVPMEIGCARMYLGNELPILKIRGPRISHNGSGK